MTAWESNRQRPSLDLIPKILEFLGWSPFPRDGSRAEQLCDIRLALGLTQLEFGMLLGVSRETMVNWKSGKRTPKGAYLERVQKMPGMRNQD